MSIMLSVSIVHAKTLAELRAAERYKLNDSTVTSHSPYWTDAELNIRNNDIQRQIAQYTRCMYVSSIATPVAETKEYSIPPNCISIDRVSFLQTTSTTSYRKVEAITMGGLDVKIPTWENNTSGKPLYYYERGDKIGFDRPVSATYASTDAIKIDYYKYPTNMTTDSDEPFEGIDYLELYHDVIVLGVVAMCKEDEGKGNEAANITAKYIAGINGMMDSLQHKTDQSTQHISVGGK